MLADLLELLGGLLVIAIGGAAATWLLARRYALRLSSQREREERAGEKKA